MSLIDFILLFLLCSVSTGQGSNEIHRRGLCRAVDVDRLVMMMYSVGQTGTTNLLLWQCTNIQEVVQTTSSSDDRILKGPCKAFLTESESGADNQ